jgi:hypothetical protein
LPCGGIIYLGVLGKGLCASVDIAGLGQLTPSSVMMSLSVAFAVHQRRELRPECLQSKPISQVRIDRTPSNDYLGGCDGVGSYVADVH